LACQPSYHQGCGMSTQGRQADAAWFAKRAAELRAMGRELDARRHEKLAAETRAILSPETVGAAGARNS
jgi:hypothetical protein